MEMIETPALEHDAPSARRPLLRGLPERLAAFLYPTIVFFTCAGGLRPLHTGDFARQFIIYLSCLKNALRTGIFPFWEPLWGGGFPFASDPQTLAFYPPAWAAAALLPPDWAATALLLFHLGLGSLGAWLLALRLFRDRRSAWFFSFLYSMNACIGGHLIHLTFIQALGVFPWILVLFPEPFHISWRETLKKGMLPRFLLTSLVLAALLLTGHPQAAAMSLLCAFAVLAILGGAQALMIGAAALLLGAGLALFPLLSFLELAGQSARANFSFEAFTEGAMTPVGLVRFLSPLFFGGGRGIISIGPFWGDYFLHETSVYIGLFPLALALAAVITCLKRDHPQRKLVLSLAALAVLGILLACSRATGMARLLFRLPVVGSFRVHARYLFITIFSLSLLATIGFKALNTERGSRRLSLMFSLCLAGLLFVVYLAFYAFHALRDDTVNPMSLLGVASLRNGANTSLLHAALMTLCLLPILSLERLRSRIPIWIMLVVFADLMLVRLDLFPQAMRQPAPIPEALKSDVLGEGWTLVEFPHRLPPLLEELAPNRPLALEYPVLNHYNPLMLQGTAFMLSFDATGYMKNPEQVFQNRGICEAFGIRRIIVNLRYRSLHDGRIYLLRRPREGFVQGHIPETIGMFKRTRIHENVWIGKVENPSPPALAYFPEHVSSGTFESLFNPRSPFASMGAETCSVIHDDPGLRGGPNPRGTVLSALQEGGRVEMTCESEEGALIVFRIPWYPGWRLTIDGREAPLLRANGCFLAARLPASPPGDRLLIRLVYPGWRRN